MKNLDITKMLTVSSAHITDEIAEMLNDEPDTDHMGLCVYSMGEPEQNYGWFIYLPQNNVDDDTEEDLDEEDLDEEDLDEGPFRSTVPDILKNLLLLAQENDCQVLCIDCDGPEVEDLPMFDWD